MYVHVKDQWGHDPEALTAQRKLVPLFSFLSLALSLSAYTPPPTHPPSKFLIFPFTPFHPLSHFPLLYFLPFSLYRKHTQESPVGFSALTANTLTHTHTSLCAHTEADMGIMCLVCGTHQDVHISALSALKIYTPLSPSSVLSFCPPRRSTNRLSAALPSIFLLSSFQCLDRLASGLLLTVRPQ